MKKKIFSPHIRTPFLASVLALILLVMMLTGTQDASFEWAKLLGGGGRDYGASIVADPAGNSYITGPFFASIDVNPHLTEAYNLTTNPIDFDDIYIVKLDRNGKLVWATQIGGEGRDSGASIARDADGYIYVTGVFSGSKNVDFGKFLLGSKGNTDIFITKVNPDNGKIIWAKRMGGTGRDLGWGVAVDPLTQYVCVTGYFQSTADFGTTTLTGGGAFLCRLDRDGNFRWAKKMGRFHHASMTSSGGCDPVVVDSFVVDQGRSVAVDASGNICVTGWFWDKADFDPGQGVSELISAGGSDVFAAKFDPDGNFLWAKRMGGIGDDEGNAIAVDPLSQDICIATEYYVARLDSDDGKEIWTTPTGGLSIAADASGNMYVSGNSIVKLDPHGGQVWTKQIGGANAEHYCQAIAIDASGSVLVTGGLNNGLVDFDPGYGVYELGGAGGWDIFVLKLSQCLAWETQFSGTQAQLRDVYAVSPMIAYIVGAGGVILKTTDGGASWNPLVSGTNATLHSVFFVNAHTGWVAGANGTVLKTVDGGASWISKPAGTSATLNGIHFANADTGWIVGAGGLILKTINDGVNWLSQNSKTSQTLNGVHFISADTGWIAGNGSTTLRTLNGGQSWSVYTIPGVPYNLNAIHFAGGKYGWAVGANGKIFSTANGGTSWFEKKSGTTNPLYGVHFVDSQTGWAVGANGTIVRTTDGSAWIAHASAGNSAFRAVHFSVDQTGWAVGDNGTILKFNASPDASFNWSPQGLSVQFSNTSPGGVSFFWDFGDGATSTVENPQHAYGTNGTYTVQLRVANDCGTVMTSSQTVTVSAPLSPPMAEFNVSPLSGCAPLTVHFADVSTPNVTGRVWSFPGATPATSIAQFQTVTYYTPGVYSVTLTVSNAAGTDVETKTNHITVNGSPTAGFTPQVNGASVTLANNSVNANSYSWNAPGGSPAHSNALSPTITYPGHGNYTVMLTAANACGTSTATQTFAIAPQQGVRIYVDQAVSGGLMDGSSWSNAFPRLQDGINKAKSGDTIWVAKGVYLPTETYKGVTDRHKTFYVIGKSIAIYGGFNATETALPQRDWAKNPTILSGDIGIPGDPADNAYHVVYMEQLSSAATLDGFTITAGRADGNISPEDYGGGIYHEGSGSTGSGTVIAIANCIFTDNSAFAGGAVNNYGSGASTFINCGFYNNTAAFGGAILNAWSSPTIINCSFIDNAATFNGGAIYSLGGLNFGSSNPKLRNCLIWGNSSIDAGPIFFNVGATLDINYSLTDAKDCTALNIGFNGGIVVCGPDMIYNEDPLFVNASAGDFSLLPGSPAINRGDNNAIPPGIDLDLAANSRIANDTVDIGAIEFPNQAPCANLMLVLDSVEGHPGDVIKIPVVAGACVDSLGMVNGAIRLGNATSFKLLGIEDGKLEKVAISPVDDANMGWLWVFNSGCQSVSQGDTLFFILVEARATAKQGDCADVYFDDFTPDLPLEARRCDANDPFGVPMPVSATAGIVCIEDQIQFCGRITHVNGAGALANVAIRNLGTGTDTTVVTDSDGNYALGGLPAAFSYIVEPSKTAVRCVIGSDVFYLSDLIQTQQFGSLYEKIASDIDGNWKIDHSDLNALIDSLFDPDAVLPWVFVPLNGVPLVDPGGLNVPGFWPFYFLPDQSKDTCGLDFVAILRGSLSPGSMDCAVSSVYKPAARGGELALYFESECREKEGLLLYHLKTRDRQGVGAVQIPVLFDAEQLEFLELRPGNAGKSASGPVRRAPAGGDVLPLLWYADNRETASHRADDESTLITLVFRSRANTCAELPAVGVAGETELPAAAYDAEGLPVQFRLDFTQMPGSMDAPRMLQNQPNPFSNETIIPVFLPANATYAEIRITDALGREMERIRIVERGETRISYKPGAGAGGVYFYTLFVDGVFISTKSMVIQ